MYVRTTNRKTDVCCPDAFKLVIPPPKCEADSDVVSVDGILEKNMLKPMLLFMLTKFLVMLEEFMIMLEKKRSYSSPCSCSC